MSKRDQEAIVLLQELADNEYIVQSQKMFNQYEITVWKKLADLDHHHYQGTSLVEAIIEAYKKFIEESKE